MSNNKNNNKAGITNAGRYSERLLVESVPSFRLNTGKSKHGDLICKGHFIEVKMNAWNQVRPYKYLPIIGHLRETNEFFVLPPDEVLRRCLDKRGQHAHRAMACAYLGKPSSASPLWAPYKCSLDEVEAAVIAAIRQGERNTKAKEYASKFKRRLEEERTVEQDELSALFPDD